MEYLKHVGMVIKILGTERLIQNQNELDWDQILNSNLQFDISVANNLLSSNPL